MRSLVAIYVALILILAVQCPTLAQSIADVMSNLEPGAYYYYEPGADEKKLVFRDDPQKPFVDPFALEPRPLPRESLEKLIELGEAGPSAYTDGLPIADPMATATPGKTGCSGCGGAGGGPGSWLVNKLHSASSAAGAGAKRVGKGTMKAAGAVAKPGRALVSPQRVMLLGASAAAGVGIWAMADKNHFLRRGGGCNKGEPQDPVMFNTDSKEIHHPQCYWVSICKYCQPSYLGVALQSGGNTCWFCKGVCPYRR